MGEQGFSFSEKYDVILTNIGTFAERAGITKDALEVVYEKMSQSAIRYQGLV